MREIGLELEAAEDKSHPLNYIGRDTMINIFLSDSNKHSGGSS